MGKPRVATTGRRRLREMAPVWESVGKDEGIVAKCVRAYADEFQHNPMQPTLQGIAERARCSRNAVRHYLAEAVRDGMLSLVVRLPKEQALSRSLQDEYGLVEGMVTSAPADWNDQGAIRATLAREAMRYFERCASKLASSGSVQLRVGFDGGQTLHQAVREVTCWTWPRLRYDLVPLVFGPLEGSKWSATVVANILASKIQAAGLDVVVRDGFTVSTDWKYPQESDTVRFTVSPTDRSTVTNLDLLLVGIGSRSSGLLQREMQSQQTQRRGVPEHFGDTLNLAFDRHGNEVPSLARSRAVLLSLNDLQTLSLGSSTLVVGVAGGKDKMEAIRTALRCHYVSVLITDAMTAAALMA